MLGENGVYCVTYFRGANKACSAYLLEKNRGCEISAI